MRVRVETDSGVCFLEAKGVEIEIGHRGVAPSEECILRLEDVETACRNNGAQNCAVCHVLACGDNTLLEVQLPSKVPPSSGGIQLEEKVKDEERQGLWKAVRELQDNSWSDADWLKYSKHLEQLKDLLRHRDFTLTTRNRLELLKAAFEEYSKSGRQVDDRLRQLEATDHQAVESVGIDVHERLEACEEKGSFHASSFAFLSNKVDRLKAAFEEYSGNQEEASVPQWAFEMGDRVSKLEEVLGPPDKTQGFDWRLSEVARKVKENIGGAALLKVRKQVEALQRRVDALEAGQGGAQEDLERTVAVVRPDEVTVRLIAHLRDLDLKVSGLEEESEHRKANVIQLRDRLSNHLLLPHPDSINLAPLVSRIEAIEEGDQEKQEALESIQKVAKQAKLAVDGLARVEMKENVRVVGAGKIAALLEDARNTLRIVVGNLGVLENRADEVETEVDKLGVRIVQHEDRLRQVPTFIRDTDSDTMHIGPWTTVRACLGCGVLVTGGPTRCKRCAGRLSGPARTDCSASVDEECYDESEVDPYAAFRKSEEVEK